ETRQQKTTIMTTLARLAIAALVALFASSCMMDFGSGKTGNGEVVEETRNITGDFTYISASEGLDVFVTQGEEITIRVEADENIIDLIGTDISEGRLKVHAIKNIGRAKKNVYVTLPIIESLESSSGADLVVQNVIKADNLELKATSGSDLRVELEANEVTARTSSGADLKLLGKANTLYAEASSGSDLSARELEVKTCIAEASSGSDIAVKVTESLKADASSGGDISYVGDPSVETNNSVSGSVHKD